MNRNLKILSDLYKQGNFLDWIIYAVMIVLAFMLPLIKYPVPYIIIVLLILSIIKTIMTRGKNLYRPGPASLGCVLFYLLCILGLIYTTDISRGVFDLEVKLSLIVFGKNLPEKTP